MKITSKVTKLITRPYSSFILIGLVFGLLLVHIIPPFWGYDESTHFERVYQISTGKLSEEKLPKDVGYYGGQVPIELLNLENYTVSDLKSNPHPTQQINDINEYKKILSSRLSGKVQLKDFVGSSVYSPVAYIFSAAPLVILHAMHPTVGILVYTARTASLVVFLALVGYSIYLLREYRIKWLLFVAGLLPITLFQAATINADALTTGLSFLLFSLTIIIISNKERYFSNSLDIASLTTITLLFLTKPMYVFLALPLLLIRVKYTSKKNWWFFVVLSILLAFSSLWYFMTHNFAGALPLMQRPLDAWQIKSDQQLIYILTHPLRYIYVIHESVATMGWLESAFASFGWSSARLPSFLSYISVLILFTVGVFSAPRLLSLKKAVAFLIASAIAVVAIATSLYLTFNIIGNHVVEGVQGRYFLPLLPFVFSGLAVLAPFTIKPRSHSKIYLYGLVMTILAYSLLYYVQIVY